MVQEMNRNAELERILKSERERWNVNERKMIKHIHKLDKKVCDLDMTIQL